MFPPPPCASALLVLALVTHHPGKTLFREASLSPGLRFLVMDSFVISSSFRRVSRWDINRCLGDLGSQYFYFFFPE